MMPNVLKRFVAVCLWIGLASAAQVALAGTINVNAGCTLANAINYANSLNPNASYKPFYSAAGNGSCSDGAAGANTIQLPAGTITFTAIDNYWYGPNALPPVWSTITIEGDPNTASCVARRRSRVINRQCVPLFLCLRRPCGKNVVIPC